MLQGDHFLVNGHKIWTTNAHYADWIFCLVRTDPTVQKHDGICFLLIDMEDPGVRPRPIRLISGVSVFCETFLENVQVPAGNLVGEMNKGWTIAKRLLEHERKGIGGIGDRAKREVRDPAEHRQTAYAARSDGRIADPIRARRHRTLQHGRPRLPADPPPGRGGSPRPGSRRGRLSAMFKYYGTELNKRRYELHDRQRRLRGLGWEGEEFTRDELRLTREWLRSKANTIEGGTSEVQLNIIAKRVLGLPD